MLKGFYNLTSGMLTQQRNLKVIANNMVNSSTAGYKSDLYTSSTFDEVMFARAGNKYKNYQDIGEISYIRASDQMYIDYTQGFVEPTGINLDFGIEGDGFFGIRTEEGETVYTRMGSFSLDGDGYLRLQGQGLVLGYDGQPIQLGTDKIHADKGGVIYDSAGRQIARLAVYNFEDTAQLEHNREGMFVGAQGRLMENPLVHWRYLERSNVSMIDEMTAMLTSQRALQSAAQVSRMYDDVMTKASTDLGRL